MCAFIAPSVKALKAFYDTTMNELEEKPVPIEDNGNFDNDFSRGRFGPKSLRTYL